LEYIPQNRSRKRLQRYHWSRSPSSDGPDEARPWVHLTAHLTPPRIKPHPTKMASPSNWKQRRPRNLIWPVRIFSASIEWGIHRIVQCSKSQCYFPDDLGNDK
jgi:hypothetical protein